MNKKKIVLGAVIVIIAVVIAILCLKGNQKKVESTTEDINAKQPAGVTITSEVELIEE